VDVAVIGAGNGGQATAAHLALAGHRVRLYDRFPETTAAFAGTRRLSPRGAVTGDARLSLVTNDVGPAVAGAGAVLVTVPGFALEWIAAALAPHLTDGQVVVLHPGGTGGALVARRVWDEHGLAVRVALGEADTLLYACRLAGPGAPDVKAIKRVVSVAALPATDLERVLSVFGDLVPQAVAAENVLATGLSNMNAVIHPAIALLNARSIDSRAADFDFYRDGVSHAVGRLLDAVDAERLAVARSLGVSCRSYIDWIHERYGVAAADPPSLFARLAADIYRGIGTPDGLAARYVSEDVPMGLVPLEELGRLCGVATPAVGTLITACSILNAVDYRADGRTLERLGLAGLDAEGVRDLVAGRAPAAIRGV
jgi:opine dehydrogenase